MLSRSYLYITELPDFTRLFLLQFFLIKKHLNSAIQKFFFKLKKKHLNSAIQFFKIKKHLNSTIQKFF